MSSFCLLKRRKYDGQRAGGGRVRDMEYFGSFMVAAVALLARLLQIRIGNLWNHGAFLNQTDLIGASPLSPVLLCAVVPLWRFHQSPIEVIAAAWSECSDHTCVFYDVYIPDLLVFAVLVLP